MRWSVVTIFILFNIKLEIELGNKLLDCYYYTRNLCMGCVKNAYLGQ